MCNMQGALFRMYWLIGSFQSNLQLCWFIDSLTDVLYIALLLDKIQSWSAVVLDLLRFYRHIAPLERIERVKIYDR